MDTYFVELSEINSKIDNNYTNVYNRLEELSDEIEKTINICRITELKKELKNITTDNTKIYEILDWLSNNIMMEYIDLYSNVLENIIVCGELRYKIYDTYEKIIKKENNNDKIIAKYLIFLMKHNDIIQIHKTLNNSENYKVKYLGDLCYNLIPLLTIEDHEEAWKLQEKQMNELITTIENEEIDLKLSKEFLVFQITHMFKIYFEVNTKNVCMNIAKCLVRFLPYLEYKANHIDKYSLIGKKKLKVGFLSFHFHNYHSVFTCFSGNLLVNPEDMEIYTFFVGNPDSQITKIFSEKVKNPIFIVNHGNLDKSDVETVREQVASFELDILVYPELGECALIYYTAFSRLAPVQITTIGHCDTSGLPNIDYYISSKLFETEDSDKYYSEKLVKLNNLITYSIPIYINTSYNPNNLKGWIIDDTPFLSREELCKTLDLDSDKILLHCIQTEYKLSIRFLKVLKIILESNVNSVLLIKKPHSSYFETYDLLIQKYLPKDQFKYISWYQRFEYFNLIHISDIVLMSFPFGGYCTALDALQMGKPIVTLEGKKLNGKMCAGFYKYMDINQLIAHTDIEYIEITNSLCRNKNYRAQLSSKIIDNSGTLFYNSESVEEFYNCLRNLVIELA